MKLYYIYMGRAETTCLLTCTSYLPPIHPLRCIVHKARDTDYLLHVMEDIKYTHWKRNVISVEPAAGQ